MRQIILLLSLLLLFACIPKTSLQNAKQNETKETTYRFVISFYSQASGINKEALEDLKLYLSKKEPTIKYEVKNWGREGEKDICFEINELTAEQQNQFIKRIRSKLEGKDLIRIKENSTSH